MIRYGLESQVLRETLWSVSLLLNIAARGFVVTSQVFYKKKQMKTYELLMQNPCELWAFMEFWETMGIP